MTSSTSSFGTGLPSSLIIRYLAKGEPNANGSSSVFFELNGQPRAIDIEDLDFAKNITRKIKAEDNNQNQIGSPLPGQVAKIFVKIDQKVIKGDKLLVIEAMKMETDIRAGEAGIVSEIKVETGDAVKVGDVLLTLA